MAQLGNLENIVPMIQALEHLEAVTSALGSDYRSATQERKELESKNARGANFTQAQIDGAVEQFIGVADVVAVKQAFNEAERIFLSTTVTAFQL